MLFLSFSSQSNEVLSAPCQGTMVYLSLVYFDDFGGFWARVLGKDLGCGSWELGLVTWCSKVVWSRSAQTKTAIVPSKHGMDLVESFTRQGGSSRSE